MVGFLIYIIFFITLFGGLLFSFGKLQYFAASTEMFLILLFVLSVIIGKRKEVPPFWYSIFFFLLIGVCSIVLNDTELSRFVFSLRLLFRFYIFFWSITLLDLDDNSIKKINAFVVILLLLQLPVVAVKFTMYGLSEETMGAFTRSGAVTTMLPISFIFYLAGYYFLYRPKTRYILIGLGFILLSIVGRKRAIAFLYPLQFLAIFYYIYVKGNEVHLSKKLSMLFLVLTLIVVVSSSIFYFNDTLNPEREVGGSLNVGYALDYAKKYTTQEHPFGYTSYTSGRVSTTIRVFESLWNSGIASFFLGYGPGATTRSLLDFRKSKEDVKKLFYELGIDYGLTPMSRIALEYGMLSVVAYGLIIFLLAHMSWMYYRYENDSYWKAFAAGSVGFSFAMLFFFFAYSHDAFWGDTMPLLYFYAMAIVYIRLRRIRFPAIETELS